MILSSDENSAPYAGAQFADLSSENRDIFEEILTLAEVPPSLKARARKNLLAKLNTGGPEAIQQLLARVTDNRSRAADILLKLSSGQF